MDAETICKCFCQRCERRETNNGMIFCTTKKPKLTTDQMSKAGGTYIPRKDYLAKVTDFLSDGDSWNSKFVLPEDCNFRLEILLTEQGIGSNDEEEKKVHEVF